MMTTDPADLNGDRSNVESEIASNALSHDEEETMHRMAPKSGWILPTGLLVAMCLFFLLGFLVAAAVVCATVATMVVAKVTRAPERPVAILFGLLVTSALLGAVLIQEAAMQAQRKAEELRSQEEMRSLLSIPQESMDELFRELADAGVGTPAQSVPTPIAPSGPAP